VYRVTCEVHVGFMWTYRLVSSDTDIASVDSRISIVAQTRICAAEMAVRYAALSACRKVHVCHCNSLGGAT